MLESIVERLDGAIDHVGPQVFDFVGDQLKLMLEVRVVLGNASFIRMLKVHPPIAFELLDLLLQPPYLFLVLFDIGR